MTQEKKAVATPTNQKPSIKIRVDHILEIFTGFSKGDLDTGERADSLLGVAQFRNKRNLLSQSLKFVGWKSDIYKTVNEVDPHTYDQTVGISQRTEDTYISTEFVSDSTGRKIELRSLAFTTKLRDEVSAILGQPQQNEENNLRQFPTPQPQEEKQAV